MISLDRIKPCFRKGNEKGGIGSGCNSYKPCSTGCLIFKRLGCLEADCIVGYITSIVKSKGLSVIANGKGNCSGSLDLHYHRLSGIG